jgi:hypothetical protein
MKIALHILQKSPDSLLRKVSQRCKAVFLDFPNEAKRLCRASVCGYKKTNQLYNNA